MLEKHPDALTDSELYQKINSWVLTTNPESIFLDYKRELSFSNKKEKIEIAKDISSFANSQGGCLIYGIDEEREADKSIPIPKKEYGILPIQSNVIDIENILNSIISPPLPDLRIRAVKLEHDPSKVVYLLWHSKSWFAPHMVSGFKDARYYKRGNFKAEPMHFYDNLRIDSPILLNLRIENPKGILLKTHQLNLPIPNHQLLNSQQVQNLIYSNNEI